MSGWWYEQLRLLEETDPDSKKIITKEYDELLLKNNKKRQDQRTNTLRNTAYMAIHLDILHILHYHPGFR